MTRQTPSLVPTGLRAASRRFDPGVKKAAQIALLIIGSVFLSLVLLALLRPFTQAVESPMRDAALRRCSIIDNSTWTVGSNGYSCSWHPE